MLKRNFTQVGVKYSAEMEVFALKSLLNFIGSCGVRISVLATDRSTTVRAMLKKDFPAINHQFDIWFVVCTAIELVDNFDIISRHFVKGIKNKIIKASKLVSCSILGEWLNTIVNMLWWSLATAKGKGNGGGGRVVKTEP